MKIKNVSLIIWLSILIVCFGGFIYFEEIMGFAGPVIPDEFEYLNIAKDIFKGNDLSLHTQYGLLYPSLIAPFFMLKNLAITFYAIKLFNIFVFLSGIIPAYLLADRLFINKWLKALLPFCVVVTPFSGLVHLVWADPLYIALFYWTCFLFYLHIKSPTSMNSVLLGVFLSTLYYAKPPPGLVTQIAACISLSIFFLSTRRNSQYLKKSILTLIPIFLCFSLDFPWMIHYRSLGLTIIGYAYVMNDLHSTIADQGYLLFVFNLLRGVLYQFSYFFIGSWGLIGILMSVYILQWRKHNILTEKYVTLFIILVILGLIALSALGSSIFTMTAEGYKMPQGRYYSLLLPIIITLTLHLFFKQEFQKRLHVQHFVLVVFITMCVAIITSPLYVRMPLAFNSMPDLSPIVFLADQGIIANHPLIDPPSILLRIAVPLFFGLFALGIVLLRRNSYTIVLIVIIIAVGEFFSAYTDHYYLRLFSKGCLGEHKAYGFLAKERIDMNRVAFNTTWTSRTGPPASDFWMEFSPVMKTIEDALNDSRFTYFVSREPQMLDEAFSFEDATMIYKIPDKQLCDKKIMLNVSNSRMRLTGFSFAELTARWTDGGKATFQCLLYPDQKVDNIRLNLEEVAITDQHAQRVEVIINQDIKANFKLITGGKHTLDIPIPSDKILNKELHVEINLPDAISPLESGLSLDPRRIALYINSIEIQSD